MSKSRLLSDNVEFDDNLGLHHDRSLLLLSASYLAFALIASWWTGAPVDLVGLILESVATVFIGLVFLICSRAILVMIFIRPPHLTSCILSDLKSYATRERLVVRLPILIAIPIFISAFALLKAAIPFINPFSFDAQLAVWDKLLHGGHHPWILLQPLIGFPVITSVINFFYHLWFFVMCAFLYWQVFSMVNLKLRLQFLWSFFLTWILLGTIGATALSSVGPSYYGNFVAGDNPFAPLMQYLRSSDMIYPIWALEVQDLLLSSYQSRRTHTHLGISAMPSLHVATSVLIALGGWRICRCAGIALTLFALTIMVGSVHLGWHYALDGYIGAGGAYVIWRVTGWLLNRSPQLSIARVVPEPAQAALAWQHAARLENTK